MKKYMGKYIGVLFLLTTMIPAFSQGLHFQGIGGSLSIVDPEGVSGTIGIGAHVDLGEITHNLVLYPGIDYWNHDNVSSFTLNGDVRYYFSPSPNFDLFLGGGLALSFLSFDLGPARDFNDTEVGLNILGGVDVPVSTNLTFTGGINFLISDPDAVKIIAGLTYSLGSK
ncbi:MAG: hypothetical protein D6813_11655 [Calditrichaeota bacterium]|nr:MAG: hypothetical protein D6813_11655 [Calditrichota bacterium]